MTGVRGGARGYDVRARGYDVRARGFGVRARGYGTLKILVSASGPLGIIGVLNWVGLGWGWARGYGARA